MQTTNSSNDYRPIDNLYLCIDEVNSWMCQNFLQLNKTKLNSLCLETKMFSRLETKMKFSR